MSQPQPKGCLLFFLKLLVPQPSTSSPAATFPYIRKKYLLTQGEREFFMALQTAVAGNWLIFTQIRMADLMLVKKGTDARNSHQGKINQRYIDFVLCDKQWLSPILAIELDDKSHDHPDRQERDAFVNAAFAAAGLPLLRVPARATYDPVQIAQEIDQVLVASQ